MTKHGRMPKEAEKTKTGEPHATKTRIKVTIKYGHILHRKEPQPAKKIGERKKTSSSRTTGERRTDRNRLPENNRRTHQRTKTANNAA